MKRIVIILLLMSVALKAHAQSAVSEDALKAAYIFHFINFVHWDDSLDSYYVCVPNDARLKQALENVLKGKSINQRNIRVVDNAPDCHVLVSNQPPSTPSMLTIGLLGRGALLEFRVIDHKLKFAVDLERLKRCKLRISSQLLKLAILE